MKSFIVFFAVIAFASATFSIRAFTRVTPFRHYSPPGRFEAEFRIPRTSYGVPVAPVFRYDTPSIEYSAPSAPSIEYGVPRVPSIEYGVPAPSPVYGVPAIRRPALEYGVPDRFF